MESAAQNTLAFACVSVLSIVTARLLRSRPEESAGGHGGRGGREGDRTAQLEQHVAIQQVVDGISDACHLDQSRRRFVEQSTRTVWQLVNGKLQGNRFRALLLGRKAVGKTYLLHHLHKVLGERFPQLLCVKLSYESGDGRLPTERIAMALEELEWYNTHVRHLQFAEDRVQMLEDLIARRHRYVFLSVDEMQNVYKASCALGTQVVAEIGVIGGSAGRIHSVITGSSEHLRTLCFAKHQPNDSKYPNYQGLDLNSTKYQPYWIYPFLEQDDFTEVARRYCNAAGVAYDEDLVADWYLASSGYPGLLREAVSEPDVQPYSTGSKGIGRDNSLQSKILQAIFRQISILPGTLDSSKFEAYACTTRLVSFSTIQLSPLLCDDGAPDRQAAGPDVLHAVYRLADKGIVRFEDGQRERLIGLGSPLIFAELAAMANDITPMEALSLLYPDEANTDIAERVVLRLVAKNAASLFGFRAVHEGPILDLCLSSKCSLDRCQNPRAICLHNVKAGDLLLRMLQEPRGRESDRANGLIALATETHSVTLHRIHVKLGRAKCTLTRDDLNRVRQIFVDTERLLTEAFERRGYQRVVQRFYFLTTCNVAAAEIAAFNESYPSVEVFARKYLQQASFWPDSIQALGSPYSKQKNVSLEKVMLEENL
jgi:hypothetical protein